MAPIPKLDLANTEQTSQDAALRGTAASGASGGSRGVVINLAMPGARLAADTGGDAGLSIPWWGWLAGAGVLGLAAWLILRK